MFDNLTPPKDIFEGVEVAVPPAPLATSPTPPPQPAPVTSAEPASTGGFPWKPVIVGIAALFIVGVAGTLSYVLLASREPSVPEEPASPIAEIPEEEPVVPEPEEEAPVAVTTPSAPVAEPDRDRDGLTDAEEAELGTSPTSSDTDADGLFDKEEVVTYDTDPTDPDTDGDGYQDGAEVDAGYNPNGPGKLFEIPAE